MQHLVSTSEPQSVATNLIWKTGNRKCIHFHSHKLPKYPQLNRSSKCNSKGTDTERTIIVSVWSVIAFIAHTAVYPFY